jgi:tripartite-type tricarboxylate transporter receptor subunit TctC
MTKGLSLCCALLVSLFAQVSFAQTYPAKPIRLVVPFPPGGPADTLSRAIGQKLVEKWGQPVVVDNRAGASGNIGTGLVLRSDPDGYTILVHSSAYVVNPSLYRNAGYDAVKSFAPIINSGASPNMFYVHPSFPAHTLKELIAIGKEKQLSYASPGVGTNSHLTVELLLKTMNKLDVVHVPFKGVVPAIAAVLGGELPLGCGAMPPIIVHVKSGKLRAIAESGFPGYEDYTWIGFFAPIDTPRAIVGKLNAEINQILQQPAVQERLAVLALEYTPNTPQQFGEYVRREVVKWGKVVKESGARAD